jgi:hypothetical protein
VSPGNGALRDKVVLSVGLRPSSAFKVYARRCFPNGVRVKGKNRTHVTQDCRVQSRVMSHTHPLHAPPPFGRNGVLVVDRPLSSDCHSVRKQVLCL